MSTARSASTKVVPPKDYVYDAVVLDIHDGDTVKLAARLRKTMSKHDGDLGFHVFIEDGWITEHIGGRLLGINAPELATPAGKDALAFIKTLLKVGDVVSIRSQPGKAIHADKFGGRWDVVITRKDGLVVNDEMVANGHAKSWDGQGAKPV